MTEEPAEWVTIAEAARRLAIAPRQARRYADRLPAEERTPARRASAAGQAPPGTPPGTAPLRVLFSGIERLRNESKTEGDTPRDTVPTGVPSAVPEPPPATSLEMMPALSAAMAYERVIQEQAGRIADLQASLEHEREASRRLGDALAREQALRALPPAPSLTWNPPLSEFSVPESQNPESASEPQNPPETPTEAPERSFGAFWREAWHRLTHAG